MELLVFPGIGWDYASFNFLVASPLDRRHHECCGPKRGKGQNYCQYPPSRPQRCGNQAQQCSCNPQHQPQDWRGRPYMQPRVTPIEWCEKKKASPYPKCQRAGNTQVADSGRNRFSVHWSIRSIPLSPARHVKQNPKVSAYFHVASGLPATRKLRELDHVGDGLANNTSGTAKWGRIPHPCGFALVKPD